jgi:hypothetical protein
MLLSPSALHHLVQHRVLGHPTVLLAGQHGNSIATGTHQQPWQHSQPQHHHLKLWLLHGICAPHSDADNTPCG